MKFLWGAATSSHQVEGNNKLNDWWAWEQKGKIEGGVRSGRATDHWNLFKEDLKLAKEIGLNSYRFSIEWSRIEPEEGSWSNEAIEWYGELLGECERNSLIPLVTLHHFTSPLWFAEEGGFSSPQASQKFLPFVRKVVRTLGNRIPLWCTFNEPIIFCVGQYLAGFQPPAIYSPEKCSLAFRSILKSHVKAYDLIHSENKTRKGPWRHQKLLVGYAHNMMDFMPSRDWHPLDRLLTLIAREFYNFSWLDATTGRKQRFGITGLVPFSRPVSSAGGRTTTDFIGINYYSKAILRWRPKSETYETASGLPFGISFSSNQEPISEMGWGFHPSGLGRMLRSINQYGLPIFITENGIADGQDTYRSSFLLNHLKEVAKEIDNGADIRGYFHWSLLDNFEWIKGFRPRFGLIEVDYQTFNRTIRPSAIFYKELIESHHEGHLAPSSAILKNYDSKLLKIQQK